MISDAVTAARAARAGHPWHRRPGPPGGQRGHPGALRLTGEELALLESVTIPA
jgi:hypothetical protein